MSWTKRQLINKAFGVAGLSSYVFNLTPNQLQDALSSLDSQMGEWAELGIQVSYPFSSSPENSDLDTETNMPLFANLPTYLNLAILIAPEFGKTLSNDTQKRAKSSYGTLLSRFTQPNAKRLPNTMPRGAGQKPWRNRRSPFFNETQC